MNKEMTVQEKAAQLAATAELIVLAEVGFKLTPTERNSIAKRYAIQCCDEVLGYMGADRGYSFWVEVKQELEKI
jgi:hypothetical protein